MEEKPRFWTLVGEALRGSERDLTEATLEQAVLLLAIPTVLEMGMESLFAIADIFFVSRIGSNAIATVGLTESMLSPMYSLAMGLAAAATAIIARRIGEKDKPAAANAAAHVVIVGTGLGLALGLVGAIFARPLLHAMGAGDDVVRECGSYTAVMLGGSFTIFLLFVINASFRGAGDAAIAMRALWLANGLNIVLAPIFIFPLKLGVVGAAIATTLSRGVGVLYQLAMLLGGKKRIALSRAFFTWTWALVGDLFKVGSGAAMQMLIETASWLALVRFLSAYGSDALAAYTIAMRVTIFALLPAWGLASAAATLVGQNLGATAPDRAEQSVRKIAKYNTFYLAAAASLLVLFPELVVNVFTTNPAIAHTAAEGLRIVSLGFVSFAFGMVAIQAFNGAGDTRTPLYVNVGSFWLFKVPLAWTLAFPLHLGPRGVFIAIALAYTLQSIVAWLLFRRGTWKTSRV